MAPPAAGGVAAAGGPTAVLGVGADLQHDNVSTNSKLEDVNTDDEADDAEYEAWKLRELRRLKRDKVRVGVAYFSLLQVVMLVRR